MFDDIEKQYKKDLFIRKVEIVYFVSFGVSFLIFFFLYQFYFQNANFYLKCILFSFSLIFTALLSYLYMYMGKKKSKSPSILSYIRKTYEDRIKNLLLVLKNYEVTTKEDISLIKENFYQKKNDLPSFTTMATYLSTVAALLSLFKGTNFLLIILFIFLFLYFIFKYTFRESYIMKKNLYESIIEDLINILLYYDDYKHILFEEGNSPSLLPNSKKDTK